jgi:hypothetical protein
MRDLQAVRLAFCGKNPLPEWQPAIEVLNLLERPERR